MIDEQTRYEEIDADHRVWQCKKCGHMEQFEADGPYENEWNFCPNCGRTICGQDGE